MMLKSIPPALTPDLLWTLAAMGHGDRIAIVDRNYPAHALHTRVHPLPGLDTVQAASAITALMPIDDFIKPAAFCMLPDGKPDDEFDVHKLFRSAIEIAENKSVPLAGLERREFYTEAKRAFAVVATTDSRPFSCFLLTKGVVYESETAYHPDES
jgi:L-fucose mutarotase